MKTAIVVLVLGIVVTAAVAVPANASAYLTISTKIKFPEVDKNGLTQYTLSDIAEVSDTRDNTTTLVNGIGYGVPTVTVNHNGSVDGKFFQQYTRPDGSKYVMPVSIHLEVKPGYRHAIIDHSNEAYLTGKGSVNGHEGRIGGHASLWVYRPGIPAYEIQLSVYGIPEW
jgi:hypothetical protein